MSTTHSFLFFFFNDTATTEIYTLSLHDALPIYHNVEPAVFGRAKVVNRDRVGMMHPTRDRKSTRLNSSHQIISYAVFCLKKKNIQCYCPTACLSSVTLLAERLHWTYW